MRRPTVDQRTATIAGLVKDLDVALAIAPEMVVHASRERWHPDGRYPTAKRGENLDEPYQLEYTDPTGETVVNARPTKPGFDWSRIDRFDKALVEMVAATRGMLDQLPAMTRSVYAGRPATDGRTESEIEARRRGAVEDGAESACLVCELGTSRVGALLSGLCVQDYDRWVDAGYPDRGLWIIQQRREHEDEEAA